MSVIKRSKFTGSRDDEVSDDVPLMVNMRGNRSDNFCCQDLLNMSPSKTGFCEKKARSVLPYLFPCWFKPWKQRFLVLVGGFLYRFESEFGVKVKGVPIPLDSISISYRGECMFEVSMIRKVYRFKTDSEQDAFDWVKAISARKSEAIREALGHAPLDASTRRANNVANAMFHKKLQSERLDAESSLSLSDRYDAAEPNWSLTDIHSSSHRQQ
mmetsp:Transcript_99334/g.195107  ORF Transcript_99334/g.195107 Transcript_99334/m.195107 type:complete len:213 (+) Transcript_99334:105-743(+)|eukprot:CAMPEP_0170369188 /NCGR_PEP_ID=MMETSP0117_2-20130122/7851_1 /TAXON_ID=400756 /ORGANISM="Durinskia baltica, Strain CSIRO CS-38" /LENGTH=212 /DNA_ID=CAMNT_0010623893 /DNA_START=55 /DNA_END=693 /DNA_ORIENTATION=-